MKGRLFHVDLAGLLLAGGALAIGIWFLTQHDWLGVLAVVFSLWWGWHVRHDKPVALDIHNVPSQSAPAPAFMPTTRGFAVWNLREAADAIARMAEEMESDPDYGDPEMQADITHAYHHLNSAWNARSAATEEIAGSRDESFRRWRQFPSDISMEC